MRDRTERGRLLGRLPLWYHGRMKLSPLYVSLAACLLLSAMGCSGLYAGHKFAVSTETAHQLPESKGVISQQRGIGVAVAAQNEVKDADVFYVVIMNESGEYEKYGKILYGDSIESLKKFDKMIDLFITIAIIPGSTKLRNIGPLQINCLKMR